ncbi:MAG: hypothetical protein H6Q00_3173 [Holophagaceae bacterium]|nr:hypothetical protein [Holophagaceae bacterium]
MQTRHWNYVQRGQSMGPVPEEQLRSLLASGELYWDDLVWREGMAEWLPARQVSELVAALPPPPPAAVKPLPFAIPARVPIQLDPHPEPEGHQFSFQGYSAQATEILRRTKPWVRFLAVLGLLATALSVALVVALGLTAETLPGAPPQLNRIAPLLVGGLILALQLPPFLLLNRYANRIGRLLRSGKPEDLDRALMAQKSFWKYLGVLTLILMLVYVLALLAVLAMAMVAGRFRF